MFYYNAELGQFAVNCYFDMNDVPDMERCVQLNVSGFRMLKRLKRCLGDKALTFRLYGDRYWEQPCKNWDSIFQSEKYMDQQAFVIPNSSGGCYKVSKHEDDDHGETYWLWYHESDDSSCGVIHVLESESDFHDWVNVKLFGVR